MINPGVRKLVTLLNDHCFVTTDSGDGKTHDFPCDRPYAYVTIRVSSPSPGTLVLEAMRLRDVLRKHGVDVVPMNEEGNPCIQATFDPADLTAMIDLQHVTDEMLKEPSA